MELTPEMRKLLKEFLKSYIVPLSWGMNNIQLLDNELVFEVSGFKYQGQIRIRCEVNENYLIYKNNEIIHCRLDSILIILDQIIEHTDDYGGHLESWLELEPNNANKC